MHCSLNGQLISYTTIIENQQLNRDRSKRGLIETMLFKDGEIPLWEYHFQRLVHSITIFGKQYSSTLEAQLLCWIKNLINENAIRINCIVRIECFFKNNDSIFLIETKNLPEDFNKVNKEKRVGIASTVILSPEPFSSLKTTYRQAYEKAQLEAKGNNWYDVLLLNVEKRIVESTISNVFWIKNNIIYTPPLSEGGVAGVFRTFLFRQLKKRIQEKVLDKDTLIDADGLFLTNAVRGIQAISYFEEKQYKLDYMDSILDISLKKWKFLLEM